MSVAVTALVNAAVTGGTGGDQPGQVSQGPARP